MSPKHLLNLLFVGENREVIMSSKADVTIVNYTKQQITTRKTRDSWVKDDGSTINNKVISAGDSKLIRVEAKTGHHGELDVTLIGGTSGDAIAKFKILSIKDPQKGESSLEVESLQDGIELSAMGYRKSEGDSDLRQIKVLIAEK